MPDAITITINGAPIAVAPATTVAAAIALAAARAAGASTAGALAAGASAPGTRNTGGASGTTRRSVGGVLRAPLCGMGVCQECRVTIDGRAHVLACQTLCRAGMCIEAAQ